MDRLLIGKSISSQEDVKEACREIAALGPLNILIKGGDFKDDYATDTLYIVKDNKFSYFKSKRVDSNNTHGTGCTYSSAIAAYLAKGNELEEAIKLAKDYIYNAITFGKNYRLGRGHGPVNHFWMQSKELS